MELSEEHQKELSDAYDRLENSQSLLTINRLLSRAMEIAKLYSKIGEENTLVDALEQVKRKHFIPAEAETNRVKKETLVKVAVSNLRAVLFRFISK